MGSKKRRNRKVTSQTNRQVTAKVKKDTKEVTEIHITGWKLWLFRVLAITIIPAFLFIILEVGLRIVGYGYPTSLAIKQKANGVESYCSNIKFSWRFFAPEIARTMDSFAFPVEKTDNTCRIFVLGASAAAGTPDGAYSFGRMLKVMLTQQYPDTDFEIITAAMPAINSHVVLEMAKDSACYQPDLFIVYLGNNEVVGPYGAGTVFAPLSANLSLIRLGIALKATKVGQLVMSLTRLLNSNSPKIWLGMEMFLNKQVRRDDPQMKIVYRNFRQNLKDIFRVAEKINTPLICCTVGSNLKDNPPFASEHRVGLTDSEKEKWDVLYKQGVDFENKGDYASAVEIYLQAAEIDSEYADLQFRLGHCYWVMGDFEEGRIRFVMARELDTLRFRADNQINTIIREEAGDKTRNGIFFIDTCKTIEDNSPHNTPGEELFYEHVHLNFAGNYLLAKTIFQQVQMIMPDKIKFKTSSATEDEVQDSNIPSEREVARYLAYTDWEKFRIAEKVVNEFLKQPPFTNELYNNERVMKEEQRVKVLKAALTEEDMKEVDLEYHWAIQQSPLDAYLYWKYGLMLEELQDPSDAARQYEIVFKYEPTNYLACAKLALCYGLMGNIEAAIEYNIKTLKMYPTSADAYFNLGFAYQLKQMNDKAIRNYKKAIQMNPEHAKAYNNLAVLLYNKGKIKEALNTYRTGIKHVPNNVDLHSNLGIMLKEQGQKDEAIIELKEALSIDPNFANARKVLNSLLN